MKKTPSPAEAGPPAATLPPPQPDASADRPGRTRTSRDAQAVPRLPAEHDESSDSGDGPPSDRMRQAHDDVADGKVATDKGEATDAVYNESLRAPLPGKERDG